MKLLKTVLHFFRFHLICIKRFVISWIYQQNQLYWTIFLKLLLKKKITNMENTPEVIYNYRKSNNIDESFDIVLGIDACSFDRTSIDGKKYSFCFYGQPINPKFPCFPIFIIPTPNGKACESILNIIYD